MAKKEFRLHGKSLDELRKMSYKEFAQLLTARMRRSLERGFTEAQKRFLVKFEKKGNNVETHCRSMIILPAMVAKTIKVHDGKAFSPLLIQEEMLGHRLGDFIPTRRRVMHNAPGIGATKSSSSISVK